MLKIFSMLKDKVNTLGNTTKFILKITLTLVATCIFISLFSFVYKDYSDRYVFFSNLSKELLIAARSCGALGALFVLFGFYFEKE